MGLLNFLGKKKEYQGQQEEKCLTDKEYRIMEKYREPRVLDEEDKEMVYRLASLGFMEL